jgi:hypothetical protein
VSSRTRSQPKPEEFCAPRCGSDDIGLPTPNRVRQVDSLNALGVVDEEAHLLKSVFESVTEFRVAHGEFSSIESSLQFVAGGSSVCLVGLQNAAAVEEVNMLFQRLAIPAMKTAQRQVLTSPV